MNLISVCAVLIVMGLHSGCVLCDEGNDELEGPLMPKCDPGARLCTTEEVIKAHGKKGETHTVTSEDGYIITIFRMLSDKSPATPLILQHGFMATSDCFLSDNKSLANRMQEAGYDVWLTNMRGNVYGRAHTKLNPDKDKEFWNFSFHEMATKDLPAIVDYILKITNQPKVKYVGHSLGTTMVMIFLSLRPEYNPKVSALALMSPIAYLSKMKDMVGPDGMAEEMANKYMADFIAAGKLELFPRSDVPANSAIQVTCLDIEENFRDMCTEKMEDAKKVMGGGYLPGGQCLKTAQHLHQACAQGEIRKFNGTPEENKKAYGSEEPPKYADDFDKIKPPVMLISAGEDELLDPSDVDVLAKKIPNVVENKKLDMDGFNHMAFVVPMQKSVMPARNKLYDEIIDFFQKYEN